MHAAELARDTRERDGDRNFLQTRLSFGKEQVAEEHVEEGIEVVTKGGFDDAFMQGGPYIQKPVAREQGTGKQMPDGDARLTKRLECRAGSALPRKDAP